MSAILVIAEQRGGRVSDVSGELIAAATRLAPETQSDVCVAVLGYECESFVDELDKEGVDTIYTIEFNEANDGAGGDEYNHSSYVESIVSLYSDISPELVLMPHSITGMDYAPAVAGRLDVPLMTNAVDLAYDGSLLVTRKMYESKVETTIQMPDEPVAVTLRGGAIEPVVKDGDAAVVSFDPDVETIEPRSRIVDFEAEAATDTDITQADFIVSVGLGIEDEENIELIRQLCDVTGATLAASRPIVELGWVEKDRQVGQSGKTVKPQVYMAIGISGAIEHIVGMKGSDVIIAINNDPDAPIFDVADYGVVGDLFEVIPSLTDTFE